MEHGTSTSYGKGCHCDVCRAGRAAYAREWRRKNPNKGKVHQNCEECGNEFWAWPVSHRRKNPQRFCSKKCAGTATGSGARPARFLPGHPLAGPDGRIAVHRLALFMKIGPGTHPCYWCQSQVTWVLRTRTEGGRESDLMADHLDGNCRNNDPANLVPACSFCNVLRGWIWKWERMTNRPIGEMSPRHD